MTNLQEGGSQVSGLWLRRFWLGLPIAVGGLLAFLLLATAVLPQWLALQRDLKRRSELEALRDEVTRSRTQLQALDADEEKTQAQQSKLFDVVTGNGDLSTFMAMVDREAKLAGVQLDRFEPQLSNPSAQPARPGAAAPPAAPGSAPAPPAGQPGQPAAAANAEIDGLRTTTILLSARGPYPALVAFLRRLELLNVLVVQSDLVLEGDTKAQAPAAAGSLQAAQLPVAMKLKVKLYGREAPPPTAAGPANDGQPKIVAPPPAPPRPGSPATPPPAAAPNPPPGSTTPPPGAAPPNSNAPPANPTSTTTPSPPTPSAATAPPPTPAPATPTPAPAR
jgi:type IV pilus assembly protein PilO